MTDRDEPSTITFSVAGVPVPQGSTRAYVVNGRAVTTSTNRDLGQWRQRIATEAQRVAEESGWCSEGRYAYSVTAAFYFPRTKSMGKRLMRHTVRPDLDKLQRAVGDGITGILIADDSMIDRWSVTKQYLPPVPLHGPRVDITVVRVPHVISGEANGGGRLTRSTA